MYTTMQAREKWPPRPVSCLYSLLRGVGASTATPALAVVDSGPTYLLGLLTLVWEGPGYEALSQDTRLFYNYALVPERDVNVNSAECGLRMHITSIFMRQVELRYVNR